MMNTCDNPDPSNYFDKNFAEYKKGFQSKGKNYSYTSKLVDENFAT